MRPPIEIDLTIGKVGCVTTYINVHADGLSYGYRTAAQATEAASRLQSKPMVVALPIEITYTKPE